MKRLFYFIFVSTNTPNMNEHLDPTGDNFSSEELDVDKALRPLSFDDFAGQDQILSLIHI